MLIRLKYNIGKKSMRIVKNEELSVEKWSELLERSSYKSPFQTKQFYDLFNLVENCNADVFACEDGNEYKSLVVVLSPIFQEEESYMAGH